MFIRRIFTYLLKKTSVIRPTLIHICIYDAIKPTRLRSYVILLQLFNKNLFHILATRLIYLHKIYS